MLSGIAGFAHAGGYSVNSNPQLEFRIGVLAHNKGPIASQTEDGPDLNFAVYYTPWTVDIAGVPVGIAGHIGGVLNLSDGTSYGYIGANTNIPLSSSGFFVEFGGGLALHDGELEVGNPDQRALGSRILFRAEASLGYKFDNGVTLSFMADHISNGGLLSSGSNAGLDTFGFRLGRAF